MNGSLALRAVVELACRCAPFAVFNLYTTTPPAPCTPSTAMTTVLRVAGPATVSSALGGGGLGPGPR